MGFLFSTLAGLSLIPRRDTYTDARFLRIVESQPQNPKSPPRTEAVFEYRNVGPFGNSLLQKDHLQVREGSLKSVLSQEECGGKVYDRVTVKYNLLGRWLHSLEAGGRVWK